MLDLTLLAMLLATGDWLTLLVTPLAKASTGAGGSALDADAHDAAVGGQG